MAPELRSRKPKAPADTTAKPASKGKTGTSSSKRKAVDDASPVAAKKAKPVKETQGKRPTESKNGLLPSKKSTVPKPTKPSKEKKIDTQSGDNEEPEAVLADDDHPFSDDEDDEAKTLAEAVDGDEEDGAVDAESEVRFRSGQDVGKAPKPSKASKEAAGASNGETGVLYVGRIPHGFYEHEMRQYFSQFGNILRLRLSRSKRTGASKHFAFLEFEDAAVAEVVQKTMDNYLLFGHVLKCKIVHKSQIHDNLWKGANKRFKKVPGNKIAGNKLKKPLTESGWSERISREEKRRSSRAQKLLEMGYEFEAPKLKEPTDALKELAALEGANNEEPKAIEAPPADTAAAAEAETAATEPEVANGNLAVKKSPEKNKRDGPKSTGKAKKPSKAKKAKSQIV
ncbi:hypothetical protein DL766_003001 [Monosporascus sp. MC13-8B]|uniref:RRM domain-containing protein n=1 Tax=Monosporascus cannonballus TaxID=155416 RepID=A0ABY0H0R3_9PEZI|nr:hypothetical protein DL762_008440 [Monosporascus cannonballus]RYO81201.1 hypothetical protein DL763_008647 [Monosporascus cannonballus]RYP34352.1 hypothetical protein DL766_003001 [Monosporascus sp. MC13-8B]